LRKPAENDDQRVIRIRMAPQDRERLIVEHAMRFFAEQGLDGQTRELARRLGITQSLIYRYFPSKDALISRVYEKWLSDFWNPEWPDWITDRRVPLDDRLSRFYHDYTRVVYSFEWVRLFAFSGMNGLPYHGQFVARNRAEIYPRIAGELRYEHGMPSLDEVPLTEFETELLWGVQATAFYVGQRQWLFRMPATVDIHAIESSRVRSFLATGPQQIAAHLASLRPLKMASD
jgi:AcrR family transcriptional regulator